MTSSDNSPSDISMLKLPRPLSMPDNHVTHTFSAKPSWTQVLAYLVFCGQIVVYFVCVDQVYRNIPILVIYSTMTAIMVISTLITSLIDPSDEILYGSKWEEHFKKWPDAEKEYPEVSKQLDEYKQKNSKGKDEKFSLFAGMSYCVQC